MEILFCFHYLMSKKSTIDGYFLFWAARSKYLVRFIFSSREKASPEVRLRDSEIIFAPVSLNDALGGGGVSGGLVSTSSCELAPTLSASAARRAPSFRCPLKPLARMYRRGALEASEMCFL